MRSAIGSASWLAAAACAALLVPAPAQAQPAPATPHPIAEAVRVNVVNVEVWVTGRDGRPVLDLRPEEFELREDGKPVALTNFLAPAAPVPAAALPIAASTPAALSAPPPEEQQRTLIVFVDDLNLSRVTRLPVLDRLGPFLDEQLRNGDRVVILDFDLNLRQLTPLTSDRSVAAAGLEKLRRVANEGGMVRAQRDRILADTGRGAVLDAGTGGEMARRGLLAEARWSGEEQAYRQEALLRSLQRLVDSLAGMPGRKALLYVSDGISVNPGSDVLAEAGAQFGAAAGAADGVVSQNIRLRLRDVARHANAGRVTFYTINLPTPGGDITAERGGIPSAMNPDVIDAIDRDFSLNQFTSTTGGQRLFNTDMLPRMAMDLDAAYSLGYSPEHFGDGDYHRLAVAVSRPGVSVRCREGYLDKTPEQREADTTGAALFAGGNGNPLEARVVIGTGQPQGRGKVMLPVTVLVPARNLLLAENGAARKGQVSITIAAATAGGARSEVAHRSFPIRVPAERVAPFLQHDVSFEFSLLLDAGAVTIAVTARDDPAELESVVVTSVRGAPAAS